LARAVGPSGHVYAVDPEAAALGGLCRRLARTRLRNVTRVLGRDDDALLPGGRCDLAVLINVYHHVHEGAAFLRRLVPTLTRDACVVNIDWAEQSEWGPPARRHVPRVRFLRDARRAGLRLIAEHRFLPHQYFFVLRRTRSATRRPRAMRTIEGIPGLRGRAARRRRGLRRAEGRLRLEPGPRAGRRRAEADRRRQGGGRGERARDDPGPEDDGEHDQSGRRGPRFRDLVRLLGAH